MNVLVIVGLLSLAIAKPSRAQQAPLAAGRHRRSVALLMKLAGVGMGVLGYELHRDDNFHLASSWSSNSYPESDLGILPGCGSSGFTSVGIVEAVQESRQMSAPAPAPLAAARGFSFSIRF